jgi:hypothetical protein
MSPAVSIIFLVCAAVAMGKESTLISFIKTQPGKVSYLKWIRT